MALKFMHMIDRHNVIEEADDATADELEGSMYDHPQGHIWLDMQSYKGINIVKGFRIIIWLMRWMQLLLMSLPRKSLRTTMRRVRLQRK